MGTEWGAVYCCYVSLVALRRRWIAHDWSTGVWSSVHTKQYVAFRQSKGHFWLQKRRYITSQSAAVRSVSSGDWKPSAIHRKKRLYVSIWYYSGIRFWYIILHLILIIGKHIMNIYCSWWVVRRNAHHLLVMLSRSQLRSQHITVFQSFCLSWCPVTFWALVETFPSFVSVRNCCYWGSRWRE